MDVVWLMPAMLSKHTHPGVDIIIVIWGGGGTGGCFMCVMGVYKIMRACFVFAPLV